MSAGRMGKGKGEDGVLSAASVRAYESALRGLDGFLQGRPATDEAVAAHGAARKPAHTTL